MLIVLVLLVAAFALAILLATAALGLTGLSILERFRRREEPGGGIDDLF